MQLLLLLRMETTQKVFGQGLLMANIYHSDMTTASSCWCVEYEQMCVYTCPCSHILQIPFGNVCFNNASVMIDVFFYLSIEASHPAILGNLDTHICIIDIR